MPRLSSPPREQRLQAAKTAYTRASKAPKPPPHHPNASSPVLQLPGELSDQGRVWWNPYIGKTFVEWKKNRGNKYGAKGKLRRIFCKEWWDANLPDVEVSKEDKIWYFDKTNIGTQIYAYVNNASVRGSAGRELTPATGLKSRAYPHDDWRWENPEIYNEAVKAWMEAHEGHKPNPGEARALSSELFKELPESRQKHWREIARKRLKTSQALIKITNPNDHANYVAAFKKSAYASLEEAGVVGGIQMCAMILYEKPDGKLKIERIISKELQAFGKTQAFGSKSVEGAPPTPCVYPDYSKNEYPGIPNYIGWKLEPLQALMRGYVSAVTRFQGAVGRVGWTEIAENPEKFIDPSRLPDGLLHKIGDPSSLHMDVVVSFVDYFLCCHSGKVPHEKIFQLQLIFAGSHPIHPSDSQETSREQIEHGGKVGWMLRFDRTVTKCHHPKGMNYSPGAHDYARYVSAGFESPLAACVAPQSWLELPIAGPGVPDKIIIDREYEKYTSLASLLPENSKNRIIKILDATNKHQHHIPASDPGGIYLFTGPPPKAVPSKPGSSDSPCSFWMHPDYYKSCRESSIEGTVDYLEEWQDELGRKDGVLYHKPSGTLFGGETGVVCVVRPLVDLMLNISAVRGDLNPPEEPPKGYDLTRLQVNSWDRLIGWVDKWTAAIEASTKILSVHSEARRLGLDDLAVGSAAPVTQAPPSNSPDTSAQAIPDSQRDTGASFTPVPSPPVASSKKLPKKPAKRRAKTKKSSQRARDASSDVVMGPDWEDSESEGDEMDFDEMDKNSQDEEEEEDWERWEGGGTNMGRDSLGSTNTGNHLAQDDDEQYDRLGLRFKYGFTRENIYENDGEAGARAIPGTSQPSGAWSPSNGVFGPFADLPPYQEGHFHTPHALVEQLRMLGAECEETLQRFDTYMVANPRIPPFLLDSAKAQAADFPAHVQPLYQFLFLRKAAWKQAETVAQGVHGYAQRMAHIMREGFQLYLTAQRFIQHDVFPDPDLTPSHIEDAVSDSKRGLVKVCWTLNELRAFQELATEHYNALEGNWLTDVPTDTETLVRIVQGLVDWTDKTMATLARLQRKREATWAEYTSDPFNREHRTSGMDYRFGCPAVNEEPTNLRDALTCAKSLVTAVDITTAEPQAPQDATLLNNHPPPSPESSSPLINHENTGPVADPSTTFPSGSSSLLAVASTSLIPKPVPTQPVKRKNAVTRKENPRRASARLSAHASREPSPPRTRSAAAQVKNANPGGAKGVPSKAKSSNKRAKK